MESQKDNMGVRKLQLNFLLHKLECLENRLFSQMIMVTENKILPALDKSQLTPRKTWYWFVRSMRFPFVAIIILIAASTLTTGTLLSECIRGRRGAISAAEEAKKRKHSKQLHNHNQACIRSSPLLPRQATQ